MSIPVGLRLETDEPAGTFMREFTTSERHQVGGGNRIYDDASHTYPTDGDIFGSTVALDVASDGGGV